MLRPVNISHFNSTHLILLFGAHDGLSRFLKSVTDHPFFLMVRSGPLRSRPNEAFVSSVCYHSKCFCFFYSMLGSRRKLHTFFSHVFISALDFVLNKLCSLLCPFFCYILMLH